MIKIGSEYEHNKNKLIDKINNGGVEVLRGNLSMGARCYFCHNRIIESSTLRVISEETGLSNKLYFLHERCYRSCLHG